MLCGIQSSSKIRRSPRHHKLGEILHIDFDLPREEREQAPSHAKLIHVPVACSSPISIRTAADEVRENAFWKGEPSAERQANFSLPPFLGLGEAANWLGVSLSTIKRVVKRGELATLRIGARQKISLSEMRRYSLAKLADLHNRSSENACINNGV